MPNFRPPSRSDGFTLVEMMGSLLLVVAIGSMVYAAPKPSPQRESRDTAHRIQAMLSAALSDAALEGGEVIVRAEAPPRPRNGGRFLALSGAPGVTPADDPGADWVDLAGGVRWRAGSAAVDPMGSPTDGRVPGTVRCTAEACETGGAEYAVWFVGHARSARASWAVVLTRGREVGLYRWEPASATWTTEPQ